MLLSYDLIAYLRRQCAFSIKTFGPGPRAAGIVAHITKELGEVLRDPDDVSEWIDIVILALDGAARQGFTPEQIAEALEAKQTKNEGRVWPDWRNFDANQPIEHDRSYDVV